MSAKNLPVISKLRQKVLPVLSAVNKRLPLHRNDLTRTKSCSVGLLPCKDSERSTCSTGGDRCLEGALLPTIRAKYHWISPFKICLLSLVWKLKSYILVLPSQSSSFTQKMLAYFNWSALLMALDNVKEKCRSDNFMGKSTAHPFTSRGGVPLVGSVLLREEVLTCGVRECATLWEPRAGGCVTELEITAFPLPTEHTTFTLPLSFSVTLLHHTLIHPSLEISE